jgi:hypothetical protein
MKLIFSLLLSLFTLSIQASTTPDSTHKPKPFSVGGVVQLNNNGISPVPAFALGKPAIMVGIDISKGHFLFHSDINYGLDLKPWAMNHWFRYVNTKGKSTFRTGINLSPFYRKVTIQDPTIGTYETSIMDRYIEAELAYFHQFTPKTGLYLLYWNAHGLDKDAIAWGNFLSISANFSQIPVSQNITVSLKPNLFYIKNAAPFEGYFVSGIAEFAYKTCPVVLFGQGVQPIWVSPSTTFNWNFGLKYYF